MLDRTKVETVIGKTFADKLDEEIFKVNINWFYTRREMVETLGCANFIAAVKLAKVLKRLKVEGPKQLAKIDPISLARARGIGESALFVAMCILDAEGNDPIKWWGQESKFGSYKRVSRRASKHKQEV